MNYKKISTLAVEPRQEPGSAGYDLFADNTVHIAAGHVGKITTGIAVEIPENFVGLLRDRSSVGSKGIVVTAGVIDPDYRGEIVICLLNTTKSYFVVEAGDKIAQMLVLPFYSGGINQVDKLPESVRGDNGFGSTGR